MATTRRRHPTDEPAPDPIVPTPPGLGGVQPHEWAAIHGNPERAAPPQTPQETPPSLPGDLGLRDEILDLTARLDVLEKDVEGIDQLSGIQDTDRMHVDQIDGQVRNLEARGAQLAQMVEEHRAALVQFGQRLDTLARAQLQINTRATALQLAVNSKANHESGERIMLHAEEYYRFLMRDLISLPSGPANSHDEPAGGSSPDSPPTTH